MNMDKVRELTGVDLPGDVLSMLGDDSFPDDELAAMANVEPSVIAAARAAIVNAVAAMALDELSADRAEVETEVVDTPPEPPPAPRARAKTGKVATPPAPAPAQEDAPAVVRVKPGEWWIATPFGRGTMRVATYDVFSGEMAAYLWQHHRDKVNPYPAR